jgi:hypothetical protein
VSRFFPLPIRSCPSPSPFFLQLRNHQRMLMTPASWATTQQRAAWGQVKEVRDGGELCGCRGMNLGHIEWLKGKSAPV